MEDGNADYDDLGKAVYKIAIDAWTAKLGNMEERLLIHLDEAVTHMVPSAATTVALAEIRAELVTRMEIAATQRQQAITHLVEIKRQQAIDGGRITANSEDIAALKARQLPLTPEEVRGVLATVTRMALVMEELLERSVGGS